MDLSGLYELIERFHRSNQLPAFLLGIVAAIGGALLRPAAVPAEDSQRLASRDAELRALEKQVSGLKTPKTTSCRRELHHVEKHADALKARLFELTGRLQGQTDVAKDLSAECERLKEKLLQARPGAATTLRPLSEGEAVRVEAEREAGHDRGYRWEDLGSGCRRAALRRFVLSVSAARRSCRS